MEYLVLGFFTGLSLILAIGAQNIFVIEQGLKKQYIFLVCFICSISDLVLIFLGIFLFHYFVKYFTSSVELIFNLLLILFLIHFIYEKIRSFNSVAEINSKKNNVSFKKILFKTLGFTYLNPHVYSDTVFFLGNFSKEYHLNNKILFGIGASLSSLIFFFILGYLSQSLSYHFKKKKVWKIINIFIISFMTLLTLSVFINIVN